MATLSQFSERSRGELLFRAIFFNNYRQLGQQLFFSNKNTGFASPTKIIKNQRSSFVFALMKCSKSRICRAKQNEGVS
jgi:hypothetical protein